MMQTCAIFMGLSAWIGCLGLGGCGQQPTVDLIHQPYLLDTGLGSRSISFENRSGGPGQGSIFFFPPLHHGCGLVAHMGGQRIVLRRLVKRRHGVGSGTRPSAIAAALHDILKWWVIWVVLRRRPHRPRGRVVRIDEA